MKLYMFVLMSVVLISLSGCSKNDTTGPQSGNSGTIQINMIDSPAGYDEVNIAVDSVQVHISTSDSTSGWITINRTPAIYDLLKLVNGSFVVIGQATVPVGDYTQARLYIGTGSNVVVNGVPYSLTTPSGSQSGVKVNINATIQADITYVLTFDFDANKSIVKTGSPTNPKYILKPVIRTLTTTASTGIIAGSVFPDSTMPTIWAFGPVDTVSTVADTSGGFKLLYLSPAVYSVFISPKDTLYRDTTITNVNVVAGATTNLGTINLTHN